MVFLILLKVIGRLSLMNDYILHGVIAIHIFFFLKAKHEEERKKEKADCQSRYVCRELFLRYILQHLKRLYAS